MNSNQITKYNDNVMEHFKSPRNVGEIDDENVSGFSITGDPECGDQLYLWIKVEKEKIVDIKFKLFGCPGAIATSSMMTVLAKGKSIKKAKKITDDDIINSLGGIPENKKHCSLLGVVALQNAIREYEIKKMSEIL